jgi:hypothetical protein
MSDYDGYTDSIEVKQKRIEEIEDSNTNALRTAEQTLNNSVAVGSDTLVKLDQQREQLIKIGDNVSDIDSSVTSGRRILRKIKKAISLDNCIWLAGIVVLLLIITIIIIKTK